MEGVPLIPVARRKREQIKTRRTRVEAQRSVPGEISRMGLPGLCRYGSGVLQVVLNEILIEVPCRNRGHPSRKTSQRGLELLRRKCGSLFDSRHDRLHHDWNGLGNGFPQRKPVGICKSGCRIGAVCAHFWFGNSSVVSASSATMAKKSRMFPVEIFLPEKWSMQKTIQFGHTGG